MILFIIIAVCILLYTIFADDWLIYHIKRDAKCSRPIREVLKDFWIWITANVGLNILNYGLVAVVSLAMLITFAATRPTENSQWSFDINALQDHLVTEGQFYGRRGYVDGELSYFYSRTLSKGELIEHIPADKTYIQYNNDEHPHVEVHQSRIDIPDWAYKVFWLKWCNEPSTQYYILVVPEGTITNTGEYAIDMK